MLVFTFTAKYYFERGINGNLRYTIRILVSPVVQRLISVDERVCNVNVRHSRRSGHRFPYWSLSDRGLSMEKYKSVRTRINVN